MNHQAYVLQGMPQFIKANFQAIRLLGGSFFEEAKAYTEHTFDTSLDNVRATKAIQLALLLIVRDSYYISSHKEATLILVANFYR
jgi:hypothetical protein